MDLIVKDELVQYLNTVRAVIEDCHTDYLNKVEGSGVNKDVRAGAIYVLDTIMEDLSDMTHDGLMITDKEIIRLVQGIVQLKGGAGNDT